MIAGLVAKLIAAGTPPDVAAVVVAEAFAAGVSAGIPQISADVSADKRREKDRIRKQIARGNPQKSAESADIPQMSESASLSKEVSKKESKRETTRGSRLPDDWQPSPIDMAIAHELVGPERARSELEKFADHWKQQPGGKGVKLDWAAAWRNWVRRAAEYGGKNGTPAKRGIIQAADDLRRKIASFDGPAGGDIELRDTARSPIAGLLPDR